MAFAEVQTASAVGTIANPTVSFSATPTNGNLLTLIISSTTKTVADFTLPAPYGTPRVAIDDSAGGCLIIADGIAATTGKPQTVTCASGGNWDLCVMEHSGNAASGYFDSPATSTDYGSVSAATPGSKTPANSTELMVAAARHANTSTGESVDSSFNVKEASTLTRLVVATKIKTTAAAENPSLSWSSASDALAAMVAYSTTTIAASTALPDRHLPRGVQRGVTRGVT